MKGNKYDKKINRHVDRKRIRTCPRVQILFRLHERAQTGTRVERSFQATLDTMGMTIT